MLSFVAATADAAPVKCLTHQMRADQADVISALGFSSRPDAIGFVDSEIYPIRVHYRRAQDAERAATLVLPAAELSWEVEVEQMGWPAPPPDNGVGGNDSYDFYLTNEGTFGGAYTFGFGNDVTPNDNWYSVPSYIALDDQFITANDMLVFVAHEFNHAAQYTIDAMERRVFPWEATAEAICLMVDDANDAYHYEVVDFNEFPFLSLLFDGYSDQVYEYDDYSYYEYGGLVFGMFLEERYGSNDGTTLLAVWDALAQPTGSAEPDFVDALATVDPVDSSAAAVYTEFALWRMFVNVHDDGAHLEEAGDWPSRAVPPVEQTIELADADGFTAEPQYEPYDFGTSYYRIELDDGSEDTLRIEVDGEQGVQWGIVWALWPFDGGPATTGKILGAQGDVVQIDAPLDGATLQIGVVDAGPNVFTALQVPQRKSFTLTLAVIPFEEPPPDTTPYTTPPGTTDTVDTGDDEPADDDDGTEPKPSGCGCSSTGAPSALVVLAALTLIRRRRP